MFKPKNIESRKTKLQQLLNEINVMEEGIPVLVRQLAIKLGCKVEHVLNLYTNTCKNAFLIW